jgi:curli production assembly/transport component CsgE
LEQRHYYSTINGLNSKITKGLLDINPFQVNRAQMFNKLILLILCNAPLILTATELEIGGLLLDNTISRQGREFSYKFSQLWQDLPKIEGSNVQIKEQVIPRSGTKLIIKMNDQIVYVTYMGRRQEPIQSRAEQAIFILIEAMAASQNSYDNPDIANDGW